jgi:hypothetical protein
MKRLLPSVLPSGFRIDRNANGKVAFVMLTLMRWPAEPLKATRAFWPGRRRRRYGRRPPGVALARRRRHVVELQVIDPVEPRAARR